MLSRRGFLGWVSGCLAGWGINRWDGPEAPPGWKRGGHEESVQDLISQIRILEQQPGSGVHIRALEDQIRARLFLAGSLSCKYRGEGGKHHLCVLCTKSGGLFTVPLRTAGTPGPRRELEAMGLGHVLEGVREIPWAQNI